MKKFMDADFLLENEYSKILFHDYAAKMPIIDYHCHIDPSEIALDKKFDSITQIWLGADHYKWRLIRSNGVNEDLITGDADDYTKFLQFATALPKSIGNPMYHWTHLELKKYFGYDGVLNADTAKEVFDLCNEKLKTMSVRGIISDSNVTAVGTTDEPISDLKWHKQIKEDPTCKVKVVPSYRPDKAINLDKPAYLDYLALMEKAYDSKITSFDTYMEVVAKSLDRFDEVGCRAADHGLDYVMFEAATKEEVVAVFEKALKGEEVSIKEAEAFKTYMLVYFGTEYAKRGWVMQIHYGATRNNCTRLFKRLGADCGCDSITTRNSAESVIALLDALDCEGNLPKTILYSLNPNDNAMLAAVMGSFQSEYPNKVQHGSAWWFNDTKQGMIDQLVNLANLSLLGNFVGMLTDSRSFLSYTRHDYFRRILCNVIGKWVENGEYPWDEKYLGEMVQNISYNNAQKFFGLDK